MAEDIGIGSLTSDDKTSEATGTPAADRGVAANSMVATTLISALLASCVSNRYQPSLSFVSPCIARKHYSRNNWRSG